MVRTFQNFQIFKHGVPALFILKSHVHYLQRKIKFFMIAGCRKKYIASSLSSPSTSTTPAQTSISDPPHGTKDLKFEFEKLCFFCGRLWDSVHKEGFVVKKSHIKDRLIITARLRNDHEDAILIQRLHGIPSLREVKARYHKKCYEDFFHLPTENPLGRPFDQDTEAKFSTVCKYIEESDTSEFSLSTLQEVMGENAFATETLLRKLRKKYGTNIYISHHVGKQPVIYFNCTE